MATANNDDLFTVNRNNTTYSVKQEDLMAMIQNTDHMIINRDDVTYKITGEEVIDSFVPELILSEVILSNTTPTTRDIISTTLDLEGGRGPYTREYQWYIKNTAENIAEAIMPEATDNSLYLADGLSGYEVACSVKIIDSLGNTDEAISLYTDPIILFSQAPVMESVTLTKTSAGPDRYTNQTFTVDTTLSTDGIPASRKILEIYTDGSFSIPPESDVIQSFDIINNNYAFDVTTGTGAPANAGSLFDGNNNTSVSQNNANNGFVRFKLPFPCTVSLHDTVYGNGTPQPGFERSASLNGANYDALGGLVIAPSAHNYFLGFIDDFGQSDASNWDTNDGYGQSYTTNIPGAYSARDVRRGTHVQFRGSFYRIGISDPKWYRVAVTNFGSSEHALWKGMGDRAFNAEKLTYATYANYLNTDKFAKITFASDKSLSTVKVGDRVTEVNGSGEGFVYLIEGNVLWLQEVYRGTFTPGNIVRFPAIPSPDSRLYAITDTSGNVTSLSNVEPIPNVNSTEVDPTFNITFPATLPGGLTPDQTLLPGTRITAAVRAGNTAGVSGPLVGSLVPGTTREFTQAEYRLNRLNVLSKNLRSDYRENVIQSLLNEGFTQAEIDAATY